MLVGLVFGFLYDRYRNLWALIAVHRGVHAVVSAAAMVGVTS